MGSFRLSRRALLRGAGIAVALPVLDAMRDGRGLITGTADAQGRPGTPVRLITLMWPNGTVMSRWTPRNTGATYTLSESLQPLAGFTLPDGAEVPAMRGDVNVISGLKNTVADLGAGGGGHIRALAAFGNGMPMTLTSAGGISVDQVAANALGGATRFPSIPVAVQPAETANWDGASAAIFNNLSWSGVNRPVPADRDARALFNRLFSAPSSPSAAERAAAYRRSVLDYVRADLARLDRRVGRVDHQRLDEHLTSIRELERQSTINAAACTLATAPRDTEAMPGDEYARLMMRLLVMAMRCDLTRYASFQLYHPANLYPWLGPAWTNLERHGLSHRTDAEANDLVVIATQYNVKQFAYLCSLLKAAPEGDGTLLDHSLVYATSEVSEGASHTYTDMPILLGGRGGGRVLPGRHIRYEGDPTFNGIFVSMLNYLGVPTTRFGHDGTAPLAHLEG